MGVQRLLVDDEAGRNGNREPGVQLSLDEWLDEKMAEREVIIMRLRQLDRVLVKYGKIRGETLVRRDR